MIRKTEAARRRSDGCVTRVVGWLLDAAQRAALLERFPPRYPDVVAHHVTLALDPETRVPLPTAKAGEIVGVADDGRGVQALVVRIDGGVARPDGSTWHVTWSLERAWGRRPVDSNAVIKTHGWTGCDPVAIRLEPARF